MTRITLAQLNEMLDELRETAVQLGVEGAGGWRIQSSPEGKKLVEVNPENGGHSSSTAIGHIYGTTGEVFRRLADVRRGIVAVRAALPPTAVKLLGEGPEPRDNEQSARDFYQSQFAWVRKQNDGMLPAF